MDGARAIFGSAGIELVLALLKAGRIPYLDVPWWPVFLSGLVRREPGGPLYVALPARRERPGRCFCPAPPAGSPARAGRPGRRDARRGWT